MTDLGVLVTRLVETRDLAVLQQVFDYLEERAEADFERRRQRAAVRLAVHRWWEQAARLTALVGDPTAQPDDAAALVGLWGEFVRRLREVFHFDLTDVAATFDALRAVVPTDAHFVAAAAAYRARRREEYARRRAELGAAGPADNSTP